MQKEKEEAEKKLKQQQQRSHELNRKKEPEPKKQSLQPITPSKTVSKEEEEHIKQMNDLENVRDLIGNNNEFSKKRIELLKPKNEREFNEMADLIGEKALEFKESKQYLNFVKRLLDNLMKDMKLVDQKAISQHIANMVTKKEEEDKASKSKPAPKKGAKKISLKVEDPYDFGGDGVGTNYDDDDNFM